MGTIESFDVEYSDQKHNPNAATVQSKKMRLLCLHGWRTSGSILMMQCAGLKYHTQFEMVTINAPWLADGLPDPMIGQIYNNVPYYQWYYRYDEGNTVRFEGVQESINLIVRHIEETGPYDGLLGFSQGAAIATMVLTELLNKRRNSINYFPCNFFPRFAVLIGGIQPMEEYFPSAPLDIPSLHILGRADYLLSRSEQLVTCYASDDNKCFRSIDAKSAIEPSEDEIVDGKRTVLYHGEGHQIPSIKTGLYPKIKLWLEGQQILKKSDS